MATTLPLCTNSEDPPPPYRLHAPSTTTSPPNQTYASSSSPGSRSSKPPFEPSSFHVEAHLCRRKIQDECSIGRLELDVKVVENEVRSMQAKIERLKEEMSTREGYIGVRKDIHPVYQKEAEGIMKGLERKGASEKEIMFKVGEVWRKYRVIRDRR